MASGFVSSSPCPSSLFDTAHTQAAHRTMLIEIEATIMRSDSRAHKSPSSRRRYREPLMQQGSTKRMIGTVPNSQSKSDRFRTPAKTDVGQSGPPQRIATFPMVHPDSLNSASMHRMATLCTPTVRLTHTLRPSSPPMHFCCTAQAVSFRSQHRPTLMMDPIQNASSVPRPPIGHMREMTRPPKMYTVIPGTGGRRNATTPMRKVMTMMTPKLHSASTCLIQDSATLRSSGQMM
mmetsp:Transcript_103551/g.293402  ORF Transcript_103551/g.293402 Transcript_103551/m.293402 type:complete len:234 (-) Transcript_103551:337-1038(-)